MIAEKNIRVAITMDRADFEQLENLVKAFNNEGIKCTKSDVMNRAFEEYFKAIVTIGLANQKEKKENKEEDKVC